MNKSKLLLCMAITLCFSCASKKHKNISFEQNKTTSKSLKLNVFEPRKTETDLNPVVVFVHGGYWTEGDKDIYGFLGRNFAKHDIVTVIPSYTLSPKGNYDTMSKDVVNAIQWTKNNISKFKGNPEEIFLMGHSAGGHLIALVTTNSKYAENAEFVKGVILNDAAGLDMYSYLRKNPPTTEYNYKTTWTENPELWKDASPVYFLSEESPDFLIYVGEKTYESIKNQNVTFLKELKKYQPNVNTIFLDKKHVSMMSHYFWPWIDRYDEISQFIQNN